MSESQATNSSHSSQEDLERREVKHLKDRIDKELGNVMTFWLQHSHDNQNGGFYNCLYEDGRVYDDLKYVWLQGRQIWMYCRLYNEVPRFHKQEILDVAKKAADFLKSKTKRSDNRCYFSVTSDGKPVKLQRTIFSECFYVMAMSEMGRATKDEAYKVFIIYTEILVIFIYIFIHIWFLVCCVALVLLHFVFIICHIFLDAKFLFCIFL